MSFLTSCWFDQFAIFTVAKHSLDLFDPQRLDVFEYFPIGNPECLIAGFDTSSNILPICHSWTVAISRFANPHLKQQRSSYTWSDKIESCINFYSRRCDLGMTGNPYTQENEPSGSNFHVFHNHQGGLGTVRLPGNSQDPYIWVSPNKKDRGAVQGTGVLVNYRGGALYLEKGLEEWGYEEQEHEEQYSACHDELVNSLQVMGVCLASDACLVIGVEWEIDVAGATDEI